MSIIESVRNASRATEAFAHRVDSHLPQSPGKRLLSGLGLTAAMVFGLGGTATTFVGGRYIEQLDGGTLGKAINIGAEIVGVAEGLTSLSVGVLGMALILPCGRRREDSAPEN